MARSQLRMKCLYVVVFIFTCVGCAEVVARNTELDPCGNPVKQIEDEAYRDVRFNEKTSSARFLVGVDARNGYSPPSILATGCYSERFREVLVESDILIVPLKTFTAEDLWGLDAVILHQTYTQVLYNPDNMPYSDIELSAIHDFVAGGGGMLAIADAGSGYAGFNMNDLVEPYGVKFRFERRSGDGCSIYGFVDHPITDGVIVVGLDFYRPMFSITDPAIDLTINDRDDDFLACTPSMMGSGNVVMISDANLWTDQEDGSDRPIEFGDNERLLRNILDYILPEVTTAFRLDVMPGSQKNPVSARRNGLIPVALIGLDDADVHDVDPGTLTLNGVSPKKYSYADVSSQDPDGEIYEGDGIIDLLLKFPASEIIDSLDTVVRDEEVVLDMRGRLYDGAVFRAYDSITIVGSTGNSTMTNSKFSISNHPNPFNPNTTVHFTLSESQHVRVAVYDISGSLINTLLDEFITSGEKSIVWTGRNNSGRQVPAGIYFYRLEAGGYVETKRMALIK